MKSLCKGESTIDESTKLEKEQKGRKTPLKSEESNPGVSSSHAFPTFNGRSGQFPCGNQILLSQATFLRVNHILLQYIVWAIRRSISRLGETGRRLLL